MINALKEDENANILIKEIPLKCRKMLLIRLLKEDYFYFSKLIIFCVVDY